jgi:hypothetical protein
MKITYSVRPVPVYRQQPSSPWGTQTKRAPLNHNNELEQSRFVLAGLCCGQAACMVSVARFIPEGRLQAGIGRERMIFNFI